MRPRDRAEVEAEAAANGAAAEAAQMVAAVAAARHVQDELLTLHCPNGHAFLDFDACFSVQCVTCGVFFCAWCLGGGTEDSQASHDHVSRCDANTKEAVNGRKDYFGTMEQFNATHRVRRCDSVAAYLRGLRGGQAVRNLAARLLARDLADLGIVLPADVAARGVVAVRGGGRVRQRRDMVSTVKNGTVREPASGAFDVTVPPGEDVQAAVDACPPGGSVLLLPGTHNGPLVLRRHKEVHVFGSGQVTLRTAALCGVVGSMSEKATLDGLIIRHEARSENGFGVYISSGQLRLQACDITSASLACVAIMGGADPVVSSCKCV